MIMFHLQDEVFPAWWSFHRRNQPTPSGNAISCPLLSWSLLAVLQAFLPQQPASNPRIVGWQQRSVWALHSLSLLRSTWNAVSLDPIRPNSSNVQKKRSETERRNNFNRLIHSDKKRSYLHCTKGFLCATHKIFSEVIRAERVRCTQHVVVQA